MLASVLQILGAICVIAAAGSVAPMFGVFVAGIALLVFGTLEELR